MAPGDEAGYDRRGNGTLKARKGSSMSKTPEQVNALRQDLQAWIDRNNLGIGVQWLTPAEFYRDTPQREKMPSYLVLVSGPELSDAIWEPYRRPDAAQGALSQEFDAICARHGFDADFDEGNTACFLCSEEVTAQHDRKSPKAVSAAETMQQLREAGWKSDGHGLVHPDDPERTVMYDPFTEDLLFSAKEVSFIRDALKRQQADRTR